MTGFIDAADKLEERVNGFFGTARKMRQPEREEVYQVMRKDYYKVLEDAGMIGKLITTISAELKIQLKLAI